MRKIIPLILAGALALQVTPAAANTNIDSWTNQFRSRNDLPPLRTNDYLLSVARDRAREIVGAFEHDFDWMHELKRNNLCGVGENIAMRKPAADWPARWAFEAWLDSPGHRANMLGHWTQQASATYTTPAGAQYTVQIFILREDRC